MEHSIYFDISHFKIEYLLEYPAYIWPCWIFHLYTFQVCCPICSKHWILDTNNIYQIIKSCEFRNTSPFRWQSSMLILGNREPGTFSASSTKNVANDRVPDASFATSCGLRRPISLKVNQKIKKYLLQIH